MSLELLAAGLAGSLVWGYVLVRRWTARRGAELRDRAAAAAALSSERTYASKLRVGDVVGIGEREYWLTSGYSLHEAGHALCAVFAAENVRLVQTQGAEGALYLGHDVSLVLPSELPARLEHLDQSFSLQSRLPVEVVTHGSVSKRPEPAHWGRYEGGPWTLWVLRTPERVDAIASRRVPERDILRWGNAGSL
ncbi:MAG TPA: hypothetical protein VFU02_17515 [Polyangiaceae bacterium]|nr:hypothetical protein [Polyangiaceae bacterium]